MDNRINSKHYFCCQNFKDAVTKNTDSRAGQPLIKSEYPHPFHTFFLGTIDERIICCPWCGEGLDDDE